MTALPPFPALQSHILVERFRREEPVELDGDAAGELPHDLSGGFAHHDRRADRRRRGDGERRA
jgi:hypothetical protein